jgi:aryl-alcohol dehydrogenase-like predicted oxidoreductase
MTEVALAWVIQQPILMSTIVGARTPDQIVQNTKALDLRLSDDDLATLGSATNSVKEFLGPNPDLWAPETRYAL